MIYQWNLGMAMGWSAERGWATFIWPVWYTLVFILYRWLTMKNKPVTATFFWIHVSVSVIPAFLLNYPFKGWILQKTASADFLSTISIFNWLTLVYLIIQVIYAILISIKLLKN
jgi:hypothetical protein